MSVYTSKKAFHFIHEDSTRRMRLAFNPAVHVRYNPETMFHPIWESSNFFDLFLPEGVTYGEISTFGSDERETDVAVRFFESVGSKGFFHKAMPMDKTHRVLYGDWDDHGISVVVPVGSGVNKLEDIGVSLVMTSESDKLKIRKYFKRIRAHHEWAVGGEINLGYELKEGLELVGRCGNTHFSALHVDIDKLSDKNKALADGIHLISVNLLHQLGEEFGIEKLQLMQVGDAFKGTMFSKCGLGKGFFHVVDMEDSQFDIIIYGAKKQVKFDRFFLGSLSDVKGGDAYTDLQSMINLDYCNNDLAYNQASLFMNEVYESIHDENKLRHLFLTHIAPIADLTENNDTEAWVLVEALRHGVPILKNPGLFRRVIRHLMTRVLDCEHGRIPYGSVAYRYNVMPDLDCFDLKTGSVDVTKSSIPEDAVVCMDAAQGPFFMYRQPIGNGKEGVYATNIHSRRFRRFRGRERVILGASVYQQLQQMGGGDMDDAVVASDNVDWIAVMASVEYPITALPPVKEQILHALDENNRFLDRKKRTFPCNWSIQDYFDAAASAGTVKLSIGPVVNAMMLDTLLSGEHKESMLSSIADRIPDAEGKDRSDLKNAYDWLRARKDYQLREVASNLETFIDYIKMGKGDPFVLEPLVGKITEVRDGSLVLPDCWAFGGFRNRGRIPQARLMSKDFVLAPSTVCDTLSRIRLERDKLMEALRDEEWTMVDRIPETLNQVFPREQAIRDEAFDLRAYWREIWDPFLTGKTSTEPEKAYKIILNGGEIQLKSGEKIQTEGLRRKFNQWDPELRIQLAVELARQTYKGRKVAAERNAEGMRRGYSDGLLWTNTVGLYYIQALKDAGLTGLYLPVRFDRYSNNLSRGTVEVTLIGGIVTRKSDGFLLGHTIGEVMAEDGDFTMHDGMICIQEPNPELLASSTDVDDSFENPVSFEDELVQA